MTRLKEIERERERGGTFAPLKEFPALIEHASREQLFWIKEMSTTFTHFRLRIDSLGRVGFVKDEIQGERKSRGPLMDDQLKFNPREPSFSLKFVEERLGERESK